MLVRQVRHDRGSPCFLAACTTTRLAVLVDPVAETWRFYEDLLRAERLTLVAVVGSQPGRLRATMIDDEEAEPAWPCVRVRCTAAGMLKIGDRQAMFFAGAPAIEVDDGVVGPSGAAAGGIDLRFGSGRVQLRPQLHPEGFRLVALMPGEPGGTAAWVPLQSSAKIGGKEPSSRQTGDAEEVLALPKDPADLTLVPVERNARPAEASNAADLEGWREVLDATTTPAPIPARGGKTGSSKGRRS
jgi:hypothetical protein